MKALLSFALVLGVLSGPAMAQNAEVDLSVVKFSDYAQMSLDERVQMIEQINSAGFEGLTQQEKLSILDLAQEDLRAFRKEAVQRRLDGRDVSDSFMYGVYGSLAFSALYFFSGRNAATQKITSLGKLAIVGTAASVGAAIASHIGGSWLEDSGKEDVQLADDLSERLQILRLQVMREGDGFERPESIKDIR